MGDVVDSMLNKPVWRKSPTYIFILRNFWEIGSTDEHARDGIECPPNDFAGLKSGKYALAVAKRKGPVAILTSPHSDNEGETCITFYYNIPVKVIYRIKL